MQLVQPVNLLPPSICIICETQPDGEAVVDTLLNFKPGVPSVLNGRKYVCQRCVGELAKLFGHEVGTRVAQAEFERDTTRHEVALIRQRVADFADALADVVNHPGLLQEPISYDAVFTPPALDQVRSAAASRASQIQMGGGKVNKGANRRKTVRPAVPNPGLAVNEGADTDNAVIVPEESDGSSGQEK